MSTVNDYMGLGALLLLLLFLIPKVRKELNHALFGGEKTVRDPIKDGEAPVKGSSQAEEEFAKDRQDEVARKIELKNKYGRVSIEKMILDNSIDEKDRMWLLAEMHGFTWPEARELFDAAKAEAERAVAHLVRRTIARRS